MNHYLTGSRVLVFFALTLAALSGCGATSAPRDGESGDGGSNPERDSGDSGGGGTLADGGRCLAVGEPAIGGCAVCCSGRCGGMGIVAACQP